MVVFPEALYRLRMWRWFCPGEFKCVVPVTGARGGIYQPTKSRTGGIVGFGTWERPVGFSVADHERDFINATCTHTVVIQLLHHVWLFAEPCQASLSFAISWSLPKFMSIESVMLSNHLILWHPLLLLPSVFPSIRVFSSELTVCIRWPEYWSFSLSGSNEYSGLISFRIDWLDLLAVRGTFKSLLQHHSLKALTWFAFGCAGSWLQCTHFFLQWLLLWCSMGVGGRGYGTCSSQVLEHRFGSCGTWAQLFCCMWDLLDPGIEPMSPALAAVFFPLVPLGNPKCFFVDVIYIVVAEKYPLPALKEECDLIILTNTYLNFISQVSIEPKWAPSVLGTGEEGDCDFCLKRAVNPKG